jgi:hypothetical protein
VIRTLGTGKVTVWGNVTGAKVGTYGVAPITQTGQGSITLHGDVVGCSYNAPVGSTLTTYGTFDIASPGDFVNGGIWTKIPKPNLTTIQAGSLTDFSAAGPFGYLSQPPGPGTAVTLVHACTVANTNATYSTLTISTNGSLTVSGAVSITANLVTQGPASSVLLAAVNPTAFTLNGNYDAYNTGGISALTTQGTTHGRTITVNGQVTCHTCCVAIRADVPYLDAITVNNPGKTAVAVVSCNPAANGGVGVDDAGVLGDSVPGQVLINGDVVNLYGGTNIVAPLQMIACKANNGSPTQTTFTINGNLLHHGMGWALRCLGSAVTVNGMAHVLDNATYTGRNGSGELFDVTSPGVLTVYGNATGQNCDEALYCRSGTLNFYGNLVYTPTGTNAPIAVRVASGICNVTGNLSAAAKFEYQAPIWLTPTQTGDANGVLNVSGTINGMGTYVRPSYVLNIVAPAN